jgi:hypothetical protein
VKLISCCGLPLLGKQRAAPPLARPDPLYKPDKTHRASQYTRDGGGEHKQQRDSAVIVAIEGKKKTMTEPPERFSQT